MPRAWTAVSKTRPLSPARSILSTNRVPSNEAEAVSAVTPDPSPLEDCVTLPNRGMAVAARATALLDPAGSADCTSATVGEGSEADAAGRRPSSIGPQASRNSRPDTAASAA